MCVPVQVRGEGHVPCVQRGLLLLQWQTRESDTLPLTTLHNTPADPNLLLPPLPLLTIYIVYRQEALCIIQLQRLIPGWSNEKEFHCYTMKEPAMLCSSISNRNGRIIEAVPRILLTPYILLYFGGFNTVFQCNDILKNRNLNAWTKTIFKILTLAFL